MSLAPLGVLGVAMSWVASTQCQFSKLSAQNAAPPHVGQAWAALGRWDRDAWRCRAIRSSGSGPAGRPRGRWRAGPAEDQVFRVWDHRRILEGWQLRGQVAADYLGQRSRPPSSL